jgi:CCR4-NOT transcription complex subunit 1
VFETRYCKAVTYRALGLDVLRKAFPAMLEMLANPSKHPEMTPDDLAYILHELLTPPPSFLDQSEVLKLSYAARSRYKHTSLPPQIINVTEPLEHMRQQESLANTLQQYGPDRVRLPEEFREILLRNWNTQMSEEQVADVLTFMATSPNPSEWLSENFVLALEADGNLAQNFDWAVVIEHLDREDFIIEGPPGLYVITRAVHQGTRNPEFPLHQLWGGRWKYSWSQWSVLRAYLKANELDVAKEVGLRRIFSSDDFSKASNPVKAVVVSFEMQKLISYDAVDALLHFALDNDVPQELRGQAQQELERAGKLTPELVLCGALMTPPPWSSHMEGIIENLFEVFFLGHPSHQMIFWRLWQVDKTLVAQRFLEHYHQDSLTITRILDITQELRCLSEILEIRDAMFVLDAASLAARREYLNLEKWLQEMIAKYGSDFWGECYRFLRMKADAEYAANREGGKPTMVQLRVGPVHTFLTVLDGSHPPLGQELQEQVTQTQRICIQAYPRLINMGTGFDDIILRNNAENNSFSPQIDKDMQQNYRALYAQETEIRELVNYMQKLKVSQIPQDQDLFACMIHGLFDEYDCYPNYPIHALATTSVLFGSIVRYKLIDGIPLRVALAMVYQAVRDHTTSSTMYKFGLQALVQFQERLREWRSYCVLLAQVPGLQGTEVSNVVQDVIAGSTVERSVEAPANGAVSSDDNNPELPNGNATSPSPQPKSPFRSLHSDPPFRDEISYEDPTEEIQDKVLFIVNNVSQQNLDKKLSDLQEWLEESHHQWFADYLVVKRAKLEPNYHGLYLDLLDKFGHKGLTTEVLRETYINVIRLLNAETTLNNAIERAHLKNLGSWLGGLTLAKDKPIKFKNISFKDLIIEGLETERLIVVLPFTCKVLEQVTKSTAFRPPNPWLMAILRLLKELYEHVSLKLNLKFEIEVLCKNLDLDIKQIEAATDIREMQARQAAKDEEEDEAALLLGDIPLPHQQQDYVTLSTQIPPSFTEGIAINPMIRDQSMKRIIIAAIERTAHEILGPVVERSVTIATIATSQLIQKDFATEPDESKMRTAAIGMAQRLAGHLALVTCKEPMRLSMVNNIRNGLLQNGYSESAVSEQAITMVVNDNLDYVCQTVENAAEREAVPQVDESLREAYQRRKLHREQRTGQPFLSPDVSRYALQLPDVFRLKPGGLTQQQLAVYDEFARASAVTSTEPPKGQTLDGYDYLPTNFQGTPSVADVAPVEQQRTIEPPAPASPLQAIPDYQEKVVAAINDVRKVAKESEERHLHDLPVDHPIFQYIDGILHHIGVIPNASKVKDGVCTTVASHLCNVVYVEGQSELEVETVVFLLRKLCELSPNTAKEVVMWLARDKEDEVGSSVQLETNHKLTLSAYLQRQGNYRTVALATPVRSSLRSDLVQTHCYREADCVGIFGPLARRNAVW